MSSIDGSIDKAMASAKSSSMANFLRVWSPANRDDCGNNLVMCKSSNWSQSKRWKCRFLSRLGVTYFPLWEIQPQFRMGTLCEFWFLHDCLMIGWSYVLIANGQLHQHHLSQWPFEGLTNAEKNRRHPHEKLIRWLDLGHWDIFHGWIAFCLIVLALVSSTHWWLDLS